MPHLLIVDDDLDIAEAFSHLLQTAGHDVSIARNGEEGLRLLKVPPLPSLLVLDVQMPILDGPGMAPPNALARRRRGENPDPARVGPRRLASNRGTHGNALLPSFSGVDRALRERAAPSSA